MFDILRKSLAVGVATSDEPWAPKPPSPVAPGMPEIDGALVRDPAAVVAACPTGAISRPEGKAADGLRLDLGQCTFCGLCAEADPGVRMIPARALATRHRQDLVSVTPCNGQRHVVQEVCQGPRGPGPSSAARSFEQVGEELKQTIDRRFGRSLHIREVDAGSCNGCELEIAGLNCPVYDVERFGVHFVASPRHADMLLVTGPVSRNMELALRKTYDATPEPRLVVAVGACGCSGGIFGVNYATLGGVDKVVPVDVYVPGCPPSPTALLHGVLLAIGRAA